MEYPARIRQLFGVAALVNIGHTLCPVVARFDFVHHSSYSFSRANPMAGQRKVREVADGPSGRLQGWARIADFLKMPVATAQRWAKAGMPVRREGRFTIAEMDELRAWIAREAKMPAPAHIATNTTDLSAGLKESIAAAKKRNV